MNKASRCDGISAELFQILKDDTVKVLIKCCTQYASKFEKLKWPQDWKGQFSFQSQRKAMPKNVQTTVQLQSFHMLAKTNTHNSPTYGSSVCGLRTFRYPSWI